MKETAKPYNRGHSQTGLGATDELRVRTESRATDELSGALGCNQKGRMVPAVSTPADLMAGGPRLIDNTKAGDSTKRGWFGMPDQLFDDGTWAGLLPSEKDVLPVVKKHAGYDAALDHCRISIKTIMREANMKRRTAIFALHGLQDRDLLFLEEQGNPSRTNLYRLSPDLLCIENGSWFKMPNWLFNDMYWRQLSRPEKAVLLVVKKFANWLPEKNFCYAGLDLLMAESGLSRSILIRSLRELSGRYLIGRLTQIDAGRIRAKHGRRRDYDTTTYYVHPLLNPLIAEDKRGASTANSQSSSVAPILGSQSSSVAPVLGEIGATDRSKGVQQMNPNKTVEQDVTAEPSIIGHQRLKGPARLPEERILGYVKRFLSSNKPRAVDKRITQPQ